MDERQRSLIRKFADRLPTEIKFVSPRIDPVFRAGNGKTYHNAHHSQWSPQTCNPIAANQKPFGSRFGIADGFIGHARRDVHESPRARKQADLL